MKQLWIIFLTISISIPAVTLIIGYKNRNSLLWLFVATGLFFDLLISFTRRSLGLNYFWAANLYVLLAFLLISFVYKEIIFKKKTPFYLATTTLAAIFVASTIYNSIWNFNTTGASIFYFAYIVYSILGFYNLLTEKKFLFLENSVEFWTNAAFLIYGSGNFLLFLFSEYLKLTNNDLFKNLWSTFFLVINISLNVLLAIALSRKKIPGNEFK
jgi:hypothetical protein